MTFLSLCVHRLAGALESAGAALHRLGNLLHGCLPALCPPTHLDALLSRYYADSYYGTIWVDDGQLDAAGVLKLEGWEADVCARYGIDAGRVLVLGCGWGREAIALAERKAETVGIDRHAGVLRTARRLARERRVRAQFVQADFLAAPHRADSFDAALLFGTMYSAVAGRARRQSWLRAICRVLRPHGLVVLTFQKHHGSRSRMERLFANINRSLLRLPGANAQYQPGDVCLGGHFFHLFQEEQELRGELEGAGAVVRELNWSQQYAVISYRLQC